MITLSASAPQGRSSWSPALDEAVATPALVACAGRPVSVVAPADDIETAFRIHGGLCDGDQLAGMLRPRVDQPVSCIARLIVSRRILSVPRGMRTLIPLFQFVGGPLEVWPGVSRVIAELGDVLDDRELAAWFASGNPWLAGARPVATIGANPDAVHAAARADRYVARGG